jgi:hypothetical protein
VALLSVGALVLKTYGHDSSVGIATALRAWTVRGSTPGAGGGRYFQDPSTPDPVGPTQPPIQWIPVIFPEGDKAAGA